MVTHDACAYNPDVQRLPAALSLEDFDPGSLSPVSVRRRLPHARPPKYPRGCSAATAVPPRDDLIVSDNSTFSSGILHFMQPREGAGIDVKL